MRYQTSAAPIINNSPPVVYHLQQHFKEEDKQERLDIEEHELLSPSLPSSLLPPESAQDLANVHFHFEEEEEYIFDHHPPKDDNPFCIPDQTVFNIHSFFPF